ncbi:MAG: hypothetical protein QME42_03500 [bacterium]|nr:hypothetical protein [bacterium]
MSTPISHSLAGINVYLLSKKKNTINWLLILYCIIVSSLPDIDFICMTNEGIKFGNTYHHLFPFGMVMNIRHYGKQYLSRA